MSEVRVDQGGDVYFAASFFELDERGLISRAVEYWVTSPYEEPAPWRAEWSEPLEI